MQAEFQNWREDADIISEAKLKFAVSSRAWVWGRSLAGTAGSNPAGNMDVCLL
jgi:hypothetical protein